MCRDPCDVIRAFQFRQTSGDLQRVCLFLVEFGLSCGLSKIIERRAFTDMSREDISCGGSCDPPILLSDVLCILHVVELHVVLLSLFILETRY